MIKQIRYPSPEVARYVRYVVALDYAAANTEVVLPLITNGHPSIVFVSSPADIGGASLGPLTVFGHNRKPFSLSLHGPFTLVAFFLQPYYIPALLGLGAAEFTDKFVDFGLLKPILSRTFQQQLLDACALEERLRLRDQLIVRLAISDTAPAENAIWATGIIHAAEGLRPLSAVQKELGLSERGLQRLFETNVGLSPGMYARICQFDAAFRQLETQRYRRLSEIAYQQGYADQSHFIRAFNEFAGFTPREYIASAAPYLE